MKNLDNPWSEWTARELRPVARWVSVPSTTNKRGVELRMVWAEPDVPTAASLSMLPRQSQR